MINVTFIAFVVVSPVLSVATTMIAFSPSASATSAFHVLQSGVSLIASAPFTVTDAMPDASEAVPATVMVDVVTVVPSAGEAMVSVGGVVSAPAASVCRITRPL